MKHHILVVEDDSHIRMGLVETLLSEGYEVSECGDGSQALAMIRERKPVLILLDVMLPGKNGFDICRELRSQGERTAVIMLTAKGQEVDKVVGLELGADDYVTKPFSLRELLARVQAQLRRIEPAQTSSSQEVPEEIAFGTVTIRSAALRGTREKDEFELTPRELKIIALLFREAGNAISRDQILNEVWGQDYYGTTRTLDQVIVKIRQKIETDPKSPTHLTTVHGLGYRLEV